MTKIHLICINIKLNRVIKQNLANKRFGVSRKIYIGLTNGFPNHKKLFNLHEYKNETELSNKIYQIKDSGHHAKVTWV